MRGAVRLAALAACAVGLVALPATAAADHGSRPHTQNMHALGHSPDFGSFLLPDDQRDANSDLAFWGNLVFHGDYDGFRIVRDSPGNPKLVSDEENDRAIIYNATSGGNPLLPEADRECD